MPSSARLLGVLAGLAGAAGVALAAAAGHRAGGEAAVTGALLMLAHAAALLALADRGEGRGIRLVGGLLFLGAALFAGDMASRLLLGGRLFSGAAPVGGVLMIAGWLGVVVGAIAGPRRAP